MSIQSGSAIFMDLESELRSILIYYDPSFYANISTDALICVSSLTQVYEQPSQWYAEPEFTPDGTIEASLRPFELPDVGNGTDWS
jgi:hypothetical protein